MMGVFCGKCGFATKDCLCSGGPSAIRSGMLAEMDAPKITVDPGDRYATIHPANVAALKRGRYVELWIDGERGFLHWGQSPLPAPVTEAATTNSSA
jgi:hypothetical protein